MQYLEEAYANRPLTDEEYIEMMELLVSAGDLEHAGLDPKTGKQLYKLAGE